MGYWSLYETENQTYNESPEQYLIMRIAAMADII